MNAPTLGRFSQDSTSTSKDYCARAAAFAFSSSACCKSWAPQLHSTEKAKKARFPCFAALLLCLASPATEFPASRRCQVCAVGWRRGRGGCRELLLLLLAGVQSSNVCRKALLPRFDSQPRMPPELPHPARALKPEAARSVAGCRFGKW